MFTDFDYFIAKLDLNEIEKVISMPLNEDDKKIALGFVIVKHLEGVSMTFPKKNHSASFARLLLKRGVCTKIVSQRLEITEKTLKKYKAKNG